MKAKKNSKNVVAGLRAAAARLNISRKKLNRFIGEGLPITRKSERIFVDIPKAEAWIALNDILVAGAPQLAPILHRSDPRWRERTASAALRGIENGLAAGRFIDFNEARRRMDNELALHVSALCSLYSRVANEVTGATASEVRRVIDDTVDQITTQCLTCDLPNAFPTPRPIVEMEDDDEPLADDDRETLKILAPPDPRFDFALAAASTRERELEDRWADVMSYEHMTKMAQLHYGVIRRECATIGARVAAKLDAKGPNAAAIRKTIEAATDDVFAAIRAGSDNVLEECRKWIAETRGDEEPPDDEDEERDLSITLALAIAESSAPYVVAYYVV